MITYDAPYATLGPPVVPLPFIGEGSPNKIDYRGPRTMNGWISVAPQNSTSLGSTPKYDVHCSSRVCPPKCLAWVEGYDNE